MHVVSISRFIVLYQSCAFFTIGDFKPLKYEVFSYGTRVTVAEVTKGRSNMATFTLLWAGVSTKPITFNATESEVCTNRTDINYLRFNVFGRSEIIHCCICGFLGFFYFFE